MERTAIEQAAHELRTAYDSGAVEPISGRLVEDRPEVGYAVQDINTEAWLAQGRRIVGRKIGLTSPAIQSQLGVHEPDFGILFEDMAVPHGGCLSARSVLHLAAEGELAFGLQAALTAPDLREENVVDAIEWMAPAIEIVGSRIRDWKVRLVDTIADNASSGRFAIAAERTPFSRGTVDAMTMELLEDDRPVSAGPATACLGSPVAALTWLARKSVEIGRPLAAGSIVLSGAFGPLAPMTPGHRYRLRMSGFDELWIDCTE